MPSRDRAPAKFGPIPPDLDLHALVEQTPNFRWVDRISCQAIDEQGVEMFEKTVQHHVVRQGLPMVVDGWHEKLESWIFTSQWLRDNVGNKFEQARNLTKQENLPLSINHYLNNMSLLTDQWTHYNYKEPNRQRLYLKDIDCPKLWHEKLKETIPGCVFYLNDSTGDVGGPGATEEKNPSGMGTRKSKGAAHAGDLMSLLPPGMRAENLMCYIGHEGTYTPAHREMCASLGQNIMVETSDLLDEGGKRTKPGSSIWFMTETSDRQVVSEYWLSVLGHDIEVEKHFAHINAWRKAPFTVYVVEQKAGDLILIPPLAPHQVWNRGTRTMKVAWNRTTVDTLEYAINEALPRARLVCRDEQYKNKSIILFTLNRYYSVLQSVEIRRQNAKDDPTRASLSGPKVRQLRKDFKRLFRLFSDILLSEMFSPEFRDEKKVEYIPYDSNVTCGYCRANIFNRFLTCRHCVVQLADGTEDNYDICMDCYAMGRSCRCISKLDWVEQFPWRDLVEKHEIWRQMYIQLDGGPKEDSPQPLAIERKFKRERTLAEICQIELRKRPFKDPKKPEPESEPSDHSSDEDVTSTGAVNKKRRKKKKSEKWLSDHLPCHICCWRHPKWKEAVCSECNVAYCYGALWRGFDMMPQKILEDKHWLCPRCRKICTCNHCQKIDGIQPFEPTGTILGHDTREYADPRSVESLVDFSVSNRHWIRKSGDGDNPEESRRLLRRQSEAAREKEKDIAEDEEEEAGGEAEPGLLPSPNNQPGTSDDDIPIDPALTSGKSTFTDLGHRKNDHIQKEAQTQASRALDALNGLSYLEQDPLSFVASAGLVEREQSITIAPTAVSHDVAYPDPLANGNSLLGSHSKTPQPRGSVKEKGKVKSRKSAPPKVQSDALAEPEEMQAAALPTTANQQFQKMAEKKRIDEAKKNKQLIAARAAMKGLKAVVSLKLAPEKLAHFSTGSSHIGNVEVVPQTDAEMAESSDVVPVVESNLPRTVQPAKAGARNPRIPKKRLREQDLDEDFTSVPSRDRRTQRQVRQLKETAAADQEMSDEEKADASDDDDEASATTTNGHQDRATNEAVRARRSLPGYLAQRPTEPDAPLPKELADDLQARARLSRTPLTHSVASSDLSTIRSMKEREENRKAKLRAAKDQTDSDSEAEVASESSDSLATVSSPASKKPKTNGTATVEPICGDLAVSEVRGARSSIFASRGRGGKIKIASAKAKKT